MWLFCISVESRNSQAALMESWFLLYVCNRCLDLFVCVSVFLLDLRVVSRCSAETAMATAISWHTETWWVLLLLTSPEPCQTKVPLHGVRCERQSHVWESGMGGWGTRKRGKEERGRREHKKESKGFTLYRLLVFQLLQQIHIFSRFRLTLVRCN